MADPVPDRPTSRTHSGSRPLTELAAVVVTGAAFLVFENVLHQKIAFLVPCVVAWTTYIGRELWRDPMLLSRWGMRFASVRPALPECTGTFLVAAGGLALYRALAGWQPLPLEALWVALAYPLWALVQQFVLQALVAGNLERLGWPRAAIVPLSAGLFGLVHAPDWALVGLCAAVGWVWTRLFLRHRSLYPVALSHAWLGVLTYYWVLERDPWLEVFGPR